MKYTEDDLRKAFRAGSERGAFDQAGNYFDAPLDEDEYIRSLSPKAVKEREYPYSYFSLRQTLDWERFCDLTGVSYYAKSEGKEFKDNEIFYITDSKAKQFNLI